MSKVAVVYWSGTGNTEAMANFIADGAKDKGAEVEMFTADNFTTDMVAGYDSIAFGCPSMGAEVLEETEFQPMWDNVKNSLADKTVLLFGSYGWGDGEWMRNWEEETTAKVLSTYMCNEAPDADAEAACKACGEKLA